MRKPGIPAARLVVALLLFSLFAPSAATLAGEAMPRFALPSAYDNAIIDSQGYRGQTLLINFFATWCPPCRKEIPSLVELQKKYGPRGLAVIGLSTDEGGGAQVVRFAERLGINYPVLISDPQTQAAFGGIFGIPTTFLVDSRGTIVKRYNGYTEQKTLENEILKILP